MPSDRTTTTHLSHLDVLSGLERMHFAFAVAQVEHAAPHLAVVGFGLSEVDEPAASMATRCRAVDEIQFRDERRIQLVKYAVGIVLTFSFLFERINEDR